jgi:hypothetical protein
VANGEYGSSETRLARLEQRVSDLSSRVSAIEPLASSVAVLTERVSHMLVVLGTIEQREADEQKERRATRRAIWSLVAVILAALISAAAVIASGAHP